MTYRAIEQFVLHKCNVKAECRHPWLRRMVWEGMERLAGWTEGAPTIHVLIEERPMSRLDRHLKLERKLILDKGSICEEATVLSEGRSHLIVRIGERATVVINYPELCINIRVHDLSWMLRYYDPLYSSSVFFKSLLLELLPEQGILPLHASMCALDQHGIVICGPPKTGKTHLNCALIAHGAKFMADEIGFVLEGPDHKQRLGAFPIRAKIHPSDAELMETAGFMLVARGYGGMLIAAPPQPKQTQEHVRPGALLIIDPEARQNILHEVDPFEAVAWLLTYRVYYSQRQDQAEMDTMTRLGESIRAIRITPQVAFGPVSRILTMLNEAIK